MEVTGAEAHSPKTEGEADALVDEYYDKVCYDGYGKEDMRGEMRYVAKNKWSVAFHPLEETKVVMRVNCNAVLRCAAAALRCCCAALDQPGSQDQ